MTKLYYVGSTDLESKKELLSWFYPKLKNKQFLKVSNKDKKLVKIIKKNPLVLDLVKKLDLMEV